MNRKYHDLCDACTTQSLGFFSLRDQEMTIDGFWNGEPWQLVYWLRTLLVMA